MNTYKTEEEMIDARTQAIEQFLRQHDSEIDLLYFFDDSMESFEEFRNAIEDNGGFDFEIIYYSNAIEYLMHYDPSLTESMALASEYGYEVSKLNSEILASLLKSSIERQKFYKIEDEFTELFESFEVEYSEEE